MKWYVAQVKTGEEIAVRDALQRGGLPAKVPQELRPIRQGGKYTEQLYVLFPGYVFVAADDLNARHYYKIKSTRGVLRLLGVPRPQPITYLEAEIISILAPDNEPLRPSLVRIEDGGTVVLDGVLQHLQPEMVTVNKRQRRARVRLSLMGEMKTVDLGINIEGAADDGTEVETEAE